MKSGSMSVPWDTRMYSTLFKRSTNILQHKILKEWTAALLKWFMLCQSTLILLHKMAFQPFWLHLTVCNKIGLFQNSVLMSVSFDALWGKSLYSTSFESSYEWWRVLEKVKKWQCFYISPCDLRKYPFYFIQKLGVNIHLALL